MENKCNKSAPLSIPSLNREKLKEFKTYYSDLGYDYNMYFILNKLKKQDQLEREILDVKVRERFEKENKFIYDTQLSSSGSTIENKFYFRNQYDIQHSVFELSKPTTNSPY